MMTVIDASGYPHETAMQIVRLSDRLTTGNLVGAIKDLVSERTHLSLSTSEYELFAEIAIARLNKSVKDGRYSMSEGRLEFNHGR